MVKRQRRQLIPNKNADDPYPISDAIQAAVPAVIAGSTSTGELRRRVWRIDEAGSIDALTLRSETMLLAALPAGHSRVQVSSSI